MLDWSVLLWFEWLITAVYFMALIFIFLYSLTQLNLVIQYRRKRKPKPIYKELEHWPMVTVQLPLYNERYVADRLIDTVAQLDYPTERLEIQVLDDSTDETSEIVARAKAKWRKQGIWINVIHRTNRGGFKAGALAHGLKRAKGSFIAIFDADFLPTKDFLKQTIPHFSDESVGVVQSRWAHLNQDFSMLTTLQAFGLDAHFTVEQTGRNESNFFINFNGTAGVWRKSTIVDAGGWSSDTLTEDLDLSYRAQLKGWKFVFREDIASPAELPVAMKALKTQQYRWTKGAAECTVKNLRKVLFNQRLAPDIKFHALFHLMNSFVFICVILASILSVPMLFIKHKLQADAWLLAGGSIFLLSLVFLILFYWTSFKSLHPKLGVLTFSKRFLLFLSMSMGLSLHNSIAVFEGYIGRKTPFVRTPKFNLDASNVGWKSNVYIGRSIGWLTILEILLAFFFAYAVVQGIIFKDYGLIPFHVMLVFGFSMIGGLSLKHALVSR
ncbi:MAG: cellulose synthase family protein [Salibacteraceae bacterium]